MANLIAALEGLEPVEEEPEPDPEPVDKTELQAKVAEIEGKIKSGILYEDHYTEESWAALLSALEEANAVIEDEEATQEEVNQAYADLLAALEALEIDKSELLAKMEAAQALNEDHYTEESWAALQAALQNAQVVCENKGATKVEVESTLAALVVAMYKLVPVGEEPKPEPKITATYIPTVLSTFGYVTIEVDDIEEAAKFSVVYHLSDNEDGSQNLRETEIVNIGNQAGAIFYDPNQYNTVDIKIYDEDGNLFYVFVDVVLETGNQTSMMNYSKISSIIVGDEVFDIDYLNKNSQAQAKLIEYINAGNEVYIKFENNVVVNLKGEAVK